MIENLIQVGDGIVFTTSRTIADTFNKSHNNVLRDIEKLTSEINSKLISFEMFTKTEYVDARNRVQPEYKINRDGFSLLVMGFTGSEALEWKLKYIQAFNEMEKRLRNTALPDNRLAIARIISRTPARNLPTITALFPEYFQYATDHDSLEYISDVNTSYQKWIDEYNITAEWIGDFPTRDVYNNYARYCVENRFDSMGKKTFFKTLENDFRLTKHQKSDGHRYFITV